MNTSPAKHHAARSLALAGSLLLPLVAPSRSESQSHPVAITLSDVDAVTELIVPTLGNLPISFAQQLQSHPDDDGWTCQATYAETSNDILGWTCSQDPIPWYSRFNCRDWTAVALVDGQVVLRPDTLRMTVGDEGRLFTTLDLTGSDLTVTLILVGERVGNLGCSIWHPFEQTIVYAVDIHIQGGNLSATTRLAPDAASGLEIDALEDFRVDLSTATVTFDTLSNNQIDAALLGGLAVLAPLPGVVPLAAAGAYALVKKIDVANLGLLQQLGAAVHGAVWGGCADTDDCLARIAEGALEKLEDSIVDPLNQALKEPLSLTGEVTTGFTTLGVANALSTSITADWASVATSAAEHAIATVWNVTVTGAPEGTCAQGATGYSAPSPTFDAVARGDLSVTAPFTLVADVAHTSLGQLDLCGAEFEFDAFTGSFAPDGNLTVGRSGPRRVTLTVPLRYTATAPARGEFTLDAVLETRPQLGHAGEITLALETGYITNLSGQIDFRLPNRTPARYVFDDTIACVAAGGGPCIAAPTLGPLIEANVNTTFAPLFPLIVVQRSTLYVAPHVYLQEGDIDVGDSSFALGMDIVDGSTAVDLAVARIEAAAPYSDSPSAFGTLREVPLAIVVENKDRWITSPPVDVSLQVGNHAETRWLPPLAPGEQYSLPFTVWSFVDATGSVTAAPTVVAFLDPSGGAEDRLPPSAKPTIVDPNRVNNRREVTLDDAWFRPDYTVEITELRALLSTVEHGSTVQSTEIVGGRFTVTARVRNIGGGHARSNSLRRLSFSVNGDEYASPLVGALKSGEATEVEVVLDVSEGPNHYPCAYDVRAELAAGDIKAANDGHTVSVIVSSSSCLDGGATESDLARVESSSEDFLDARFAGLETVEWGTDNRGQASSGLGNGTSNAPILDRIDP